jgi:Zn-dependent protease
MNFGVPLGRLFGIEIRAHWTWIFLMAMVTVIFGEGLSTQTDVRVDAAWGWGAAAVTAGLVFVSVTVHELAHVWIARRNGIGGNVVVIQLLGGTYLMEVRPRTWQEELKIAVAGPFVSVLLLAVFATIAGVIELGWGGSHNVPQGIAAVSFVAEVVALFNFFLAVTNLIPGYPMDGGRIVHALAWARSGRDEAATQVASRAGRIVGFGIMATGVVTGVIVDLWPGLALTLAGWLLVGSSRILDRRLMLQNLIAGARVSDAADSDPARLPPQLTLDLFAGEFLGDRLGGAALVERGQELLGLIGTAQIRRIPRRRWPVMRTEQAMVPLGSVPWTSGDADLWPALEILERSGLDGLLIGTGEHVSALLTRRSAARLIRERFEQRARESGTLLQVRRFPGRRTPPASGTPPESGTPPAPPAPAAGPEGSTDPSSDDANDE